MRTYLKRFFSSTAGFIIGFFISSSVLNSTSEDDIPTINLVTLNWPPYYAESLPEQGVITKIVRSTFKKANMNVEITFKPWARALKEAETGIKDGLLGAYKTEERFEKMHYSIPIFNVEEVLFQNSKKPLITFDSLEDLKPYSIGILISASHSEEFDKAEFLNKNPAPNIKSLIQMLLSSRVDLVALSKIVALDYMNKNDPDRVSEILSISPSLSINPLYVTIGRMHPNGEAIIDKINKAYLELEDNGQIKEITSEFGF